MRDEFVFEVLRAKDLSPGDYILVKCPEEKEEVAINWAETFFKDSRCHIAVIHDDMSVSVIKDNTQN